MGRLDIDMAGKVYLAAVLFVVQNLHVKAGILCYNCTSPHYGICEKIDRCKDNEVCYREGQVTTSGVVYISGCKEKQDCSTVNGVNGNAVLGKRQNLRQCSKCCETEYCNFALCDLRLTAIDHCITNPCKNNGVCQSSDSGYTCTCVDGYNGLHCENAINNCITNPCKNNGVCQRSSTGYTCTCVDGYNGLHCENECASSNNFIWNGHCYYITQLSRDWHHSSCVSQFHSMTLVVIDSPEENSALAAFLAKRNLANQMVWIGAKQLHKHHHDWVWIDNQRVRTDVNLWSTEPHSVTDQCLAIQNGKWRGSQCDQRYHHLCERPLLGDTGDIEIAKSNCNVVQVCYTLVKSLTPWSEDICHSRGLRLATILSNHRHNVIVNFIRNEQHYQGLIWLGGHMVNNHLIWDKDSQMLSVNMTSVHWKQPPGDGDCVALDGDKWSRMPCNQQYYHLCENRFK